MNISEAVFSRRSIRAYTEEKLTQDELELLEKAALASPTARNDQTWHFTFVTDKALLDAFNSELVKVLGREENSFNVFYHAPLAVFISGPVGNHWAPIDAGIAVENLALACMDRDLGSVILGLPGPLFASERGEYWRKALKMPEGDEFLIAIAIGHPAATKEAHPIKEGKLDVIP